MLMALAACAKPQTDLAQLRFVNATSASGTLDLYETDNELAHAQAMGTASGYLGLDAATYALRVRATGSAGNLVESSQALVKSTHYTMVAYGSDGNIKLATLTETTASPASGYAKLRVLNTTGDAAGLDVFVTDAATGLDAAPKAFAAVAAGATSTTSTVAGGTYRLRVTGADDRSDLRLDIGSFALPDQSVTTLLLVPGTGGVLVNAMAVREQGSVVALANASSRVRVVAGLTGNGTVTVSANAQVLASGLRAPAISGYLQVNAGQPAWSVLANGAAIAGPSTALSAAADYTLLVHGDAAAPVVTLLNDDNRLPSSSSKLKMRLVNAVIGLAGAAALTVDYAVVAGDVGYGAASAYGSLTAATASRVEATGSSSGASLYLNTDVNLVAQGVYSVFVLGGADAPAGLLRRDR